MPRLFVAIDLPPETRHSLAGLCFGIPGARWVDPEQIHLTLRFIGDVDGAVFHDIRDGLAGIQAHHFQLRLRGVGHFPPRKEPRVLWAGIEPSDPLILLRKKIESTLTGLGLPAEARKFSPHITLARLNRSPVHKVGQFLAGNNLFSTEPFTVQEFFLYSSFLRANGAIHTIEADYPLTT